MEKVCIIIPTYPPHYHYLSFLENLEKKDEFDIYFILSFNEDKNNLPKTNNYKLIILEDYFCKEDIQKIIQKQCIITFKKYFGLNLLHGNYRYLATVDSEIKFKNINNIYEKFDILCKRKKILACKISTQNRFYNMIQDINKTSSIFFTKNFELSILNEKLSNFEFYFWFSDIPVYDSKLVNDFLEYINFKNYMVFVDKVNFNIFDYIPYMYYCIIYHGWEIINIRDYGITRNWSLEGCTLEEHKLVVHNTGIEPLCMTDCWYVDCPETKNIFLTFNIDRGPDHVLSQMPNI